MKYIYVPILARNVWFPDETEQYLKELQEKAANFNVEKWITSNLRNYIINKMNLSKLPKTIRQQVTSHPDKFPEWLQQKIDDPEIYYIPSIKLLSFAHVIDYLNTLGSNVSNMSVEEAVKQTRQWDIQLAKKRKEAEKLRKENDKDAKGVVLIDKFPGGYTMVSLKSKASLIREGELMGHCVGGESYYNKVRKGVTQIFSLRDSKNQPHVTIEYDVARKKVVQIKGKENNPPSEKYRKMVIDFLESGVVPIKGIVNNDLIGMDLLYIDGNIVSIDKSSDIDVRNLTLNYIDKPLIVNSITAYDMDISNLELKCNYINAENIIIDNCTVTVRDIKAENIQISNDANLDIDINTIQAKEVNLYSGISVRLQCSQCYVSHYVEKGTVHLESNSKIDSLKCESRRISVGDNVYIGQISLGDVEDYNFWPFTKIEGKVTFGNLDWTYSTLDYLPSRLTVKDTLTLDISNIPETVDNGVKCSKVLITDCVSKYPANEYSYNLLKTLLETIQVKEIIIDGILVYDKLREIAPQLKIRKVV